MKEENKEFITEWTGNTSSIRDKQSNDLNQRKRKRSEGRDQESGGLNTIPPKDGNLEDIGEDTGVVVNDAYNLTEEDKRKSN